MNTHIQIRNVPLAVHRKLKRRAASVEMTITDYVKKLIVRDLEKPTLAELAARVAKAPPVFTADEIVAIIRQDRESH